MIKVSQLKRRRARAILAGGMVLGLGAAVTMAAWSDSEFASGIFNTGSFNLQGSATGGDFQDHASIGDRASLDFTMTPRELTPNDTVAAPFAVQLAKGTTYGADLVLTNATLTGGLTGLTYDIVETTAFGCDTGTVGDPLVRSTQFGTTPDSRQIKIDAPAADSPSKTVNLCFRVTAGEKLEQNATSNATWQLTASSVS